MEHQFTKERDGEGSTFEDEPILAYGAILHVKVDIPSGKSIINLLNVIYVPSFKTNLISCGILQDKGLRLGRCCLLRDGKPLIFFTKHDGHCLTEDNTSNETTATPATSATSDTSDQISQTSVPASFAITRSAAHVAEGLEEQEEEYISL